MSDQIFSVDRIESDIKIAQENHTLKQFLEQLKLVNHRQKSFLGTLLLWVK